MIKVICWNARSINTKRALERIQKVYNLSLIAILEPFSDSSQLYNFRLQLNMDNASCNQNGKIWLFWTTNYTCNVLETDEQHITCELKHMEWCDSFIISFIYAKCRDYLRRPIWDRLLHFSNLDKPSMEEKQGGLMYNMNKSFDFISVIEACGLTDLGYNSQHFFGG